VTPVGVVPVEVVERLLEALHDALLVPDDVPAEQAVKVAYVRCHVAAGGLKAHLDAIRTRPDVPAGTLFDTTIDLMRFLIATTPDGEVLGGVPQGELRRRLVSTQPSPTP
jgi:hypothetical protein